MSTSSSAPHQSRWGEYYKTEEGERVTALDGLQPWHAYAVIATKA